ncbi:hypothetical protein L218DRAFT_955504 [Marasmius fiardii PR-910]|nr:hypothetical protein L218DRAFT_955504 [Marasmius fiardii PR-910]
MQGSNAVERSAVAQKLAKACEEKELLVTFFFSSEDPNRNNPRYLVLAIVHEMSLAISSIRNRILGIVEDRPDILQASIETQFKTLVVGNFLSWRSKLRDAFSPSRIMTASSTLVIIDGLDECLSVSEQERVLSLVQSAMEKKLPVRFLICSRLEPEIQKIFNGDGLRQYMEMISLDSNDSNPLEPLCPSYDQNSRYSGGR